MAKIMFNDKTYLNEEPNIADENKVKDTDMNELKYGTNDILGLLGVSVNNYVENQNYVVDDRVVYNNQIYDCIGATTGTWDNTKWELVPLFVETDNVLKINPKFLSEVETGAVTFNSTYVTNPEVNVIKKTDKIVNMTIVFSAKTQIPTWTQFGTIVSKFAPSATFIRSTAIGNNNTIYPLQVRKEGNSVYTMASTLPANTTISFNVVYFTD
jgi:hypothetical protein